MSACPNACDAGHVACWNPGGPCRKPNDPACDLCGGCNECGSPRPCIAARECACSTGTPPGAYDANCVKCRSAVAQVEAQFRTELARFGTNPP